MKKLLSLALALSFLPVLACAKEKTDAYGRTKLFNAASYDDAVKLIQKGADMRFKDCAGVDPLTSTLFAVVQGADSYCGGSRLVVSASFISPGQDKIGLAKALIDNGVLNAYTEQEKLKLDVHALTYKARNPGGNEPADIIIKALGDDILKKAVNTPDEDGDTALAVAVGKSNKPVVDWLLKLGADVCYRDDRGRGMIFRASINSVYYKANYDKNCVPESAMVKQFMVQMKAKGCFKDSDAADAAAIQKACPAQWAGAALVNKNITAGADSFYVSRIDSSAVARPDSILNKRK